MMFKMPLASTCSDKEKKGQTLIDLLERQSSLCPARTAFVFLHDDGVQTTECTWSGLLQRARAIAAHLQSKIKPGEPVVLAYPSGMEFIEAFFGCVYAGSIAVPAWAPRSARDAIRLQAVLTDCKAGLILGTEKSQQRAESISGRAPLLASLPWFVTAQIPDDSALDWRRPQLDTASISHLQYTSGSTATPKGVIITHGNVIANNQFIDSSFCHDEHSISVSWLPHFHDMGLVYGIIQPVYNGFTSVLISPTSFAQQPLRWLQTISRYRATHSGGPNFAYQQCVDRIAPSERDQLQLQSWRVAYSGAEMVRASTLRSFSAAFERHGFSQNAFYPAYGLAEATLKVAGGKCPGSPIVCAFEGSTLEEGKAVECGESEPASRVLVGCGHGPGIRACDPQTLRELPEGEVGEIWVSTQSVGAGYWNRPVETSEVFHARIPGQDAQTWLRTGDLGFIHRENLFVVGRLKDIIIVRGANHAAEQIELTAEQAHPGLRRGSSAAFTVDGAPEDRVVIAIELDRRILADESTEIATAIRRAVVANHGLQVHTISLLRGGTIPRTSSGKIQRSVCRDKFLKDSLNEITRITLQHLTTTPERPSGQLSPIVDELSRMTAELLGIECSFLDITKPLSDFGLDSLTAAVLGRSIEAQFAISIPWVELLDVPSIHALAADILQRLNGRIDVQKNDEDTFWWRKIRHASASELNETSLEQQRMWFVHRLNPDSSALHVAGAIQFPSSVEVQYLKAALNTLVLRHESLRTCFFESEGNVRTSIANLILPLPIVELAGKALEKSKAEALQQARVFAREPFDLERGPLVRVMLFRLTGFDILAVVMHHIISDAWSMRLFASELGFLYSQLSNQNPPSLPDIPCTYREFAVAQRLVARESPAQESILYWESQLCDLPEPLQLGSSKEITPLNSADPQLHAHLPHETSAALTEFSRRLGVTPFTTMLGILAILLFRLTGREEFVIASPVSGRQWPGTDCIIGLFAFPVPLRINFKREMKFSTALAKVRETAMSAFAHQNVSLSQIASAAKVRSLRNRNRLFQTIFSVLPDIGSTLPNGMELHEIDTGATDADLFVTVEHRRDGLEFRAAYNNDIFEASFIVDLLHHYTELLAVAIANPDSKISDLPFMFEPGPAAHRLKIVLAASFTADPLVDVIKFWERYLELSAEVHLAPYDQVFQQLLDPESMMRGNVNGINVILIRLQDWLGSDWDSLERNCGDFALALTNAVACSTGAHWIVAICPPSKTVDDASRRAMSESESALRNRLEQFHQIYTVTSSELLKSHSQADIDDEYLYRLSAIPYVPVFFTTLGTTISRKIRLLVSPPYKAVVVDCDQTLWNGICGEDGPQGIKIDEPALALQAFLLEQQEAGMLICLCSKNNENDVWRVFEERSEMILRRKHIASTRINWEPKAENIQSLAAELNLRPSSLIFIDDDQMECAQMRACCPAVLTLQLPSLRTQTRQFLENVWAFDHLKTTREDRLRTEFHRMNGQREELKTKASTIEQFVAALELEVQIMPLRLHEIHRAAQLTMRTNQFNCNPVRRTEAAIQQLVEAAPNCCLGVHVKDRFGDYGLVGFMIASRGEKVLQVEAFLLSCRALGRRVEHRMMERLREIARENGIYLIEGKLSRTPHNQPVLNFLNDIAADIQGDGTEGVFRLGAVHDQMQMTAINIERS